MSLNLLDRVKNEITTTVIDKISNYVGESRGNTSNAVTGAIPTILGFITEKSKVDSSANTLINLATKGDLTDLFKDSNFTDVYERNRDSLMVQGKTLLTGLFGDKEAKLSQEIANYARIEKDASSNILAAILPLIMNVLGGEISKQGLTAESLSGLFAEQKESIFAAIPSGLESLVGALGLGKMGSVVSETTTRVAPSIQGKTMETQAEATKRVNDNIDLSDDDDDNEASGFTKWLFPLLGIIVALGLLWLLMKQCNDDTTADAAKTEINTSEIQNFATYTLNENQEVVNAQASPLLNADSNPIVIDNDNYKLIEDGFVVDANGDLVYDMDGAAIKIVDKIAIVSNEVSGDYDEAKNRFVYDIGETTEITLADGTKLNVGNKSTEWKLYDFITNESNTVSDDKTQGWITMDRVYFETNLNTLDAESRQQLDNIAAILKAYPNAQAKFGGYTDNAGADDVNVPLSEARAKAVMADVVNAGIDAGRLTADGYGSQHPICPANDTPACMAQNRRVDIRVTAK
ncbi:OmpA family protein [Weeksellaceae bacterium KMM 9724]|uniref:OmpA family protein n=1 Tax=Profundicola chukchiensis TaxID=2961959 RepID=UPI00243E1967|nr:OmpA family protein [Profundicola chukchiensis]MDG4951156.1 OmpA family protein [Profundicola chukchiensis]